MRSLFILLRLKIDELQNFWNQKFVKLLAAKTRRSGKHQKFSSCWDKHLIKICKELIFLFKSPYNLIFHNLKMSFLDGRIPPRVMHNNRRWEKRKTEWHTLKVSLFIYVRSLQRNNRRELQSSRLRESSRTSRTSFPVSSRPYSKHPAVPYIKSCMKLCSAFVYGCAACMKILISLRKKICLFT